MSDTHEPAGAEPVPTQAGDAPAGPEVSSRPRGARRAMARRWLRRIVLAASAVLAAWLVAFFTVDIGDISIGGRSLRTFAEARATRFLERPMHIGRLVAYVTPGRFGFENVVIEGPTPDARPFFSAERITVNIPWWTLFRRELYLEVRLSGWHMTVENWAEGGARMPRLTSRNPSTGPSTIKVRSMAVWANDGEFVYDDHVANWGVVARNLNFSLVRAGNLGTYVGTARFTNGTTRIQSAVPMRTDFATWFQLTGSTVKLRHIDLITDGAKSHVSGFVNFGRWPEQEYRVSSEVDFARMREIFFANESWRLSGEGKFTGIFRLWKDGRELVGQFESEEAGLGLGHAEWRFPRLHGALEWTPTRFTVTHADSDLLGGRMRLSYGLAPLGTPHGSTATLSADYQGVDLYRFTRQFGWTALEPQGRMQGKVSMAWPNGRFRSGLQGSGETVITPPAGAAMASRDLPADARDIPPEPVFLKYRPYGFFPLAADTRYRFSASTLDFDPGWVATPTTHVTFNGHARGGPVSVPFHVTSHDWQDSDRLFAAIMTNFASETGAIEVGGRGTFDGVLTKAFNAPRIEGTFAGTGMWAWGQVWGRATGRIAIEDKYMHLEDGRIEHASGGRVLTSGKYSLGYPRDDTGVEIDARVRVEDFPMAPLRRAFKLDDWPVDGTVAEADMTLRGAYEKPAGSGAMRVVAGSAWDEPFESTTGDLLFEGDGSLRVRAMKMAKAGGTITGDAWVSWAENRYSFRADTEASGIPVSDLKLFTFERAPLSGQLTFTARGDGSFDTPSWTFNGQIGDLYAGSEGVGAIVGRLNLDNRLLQVDVVAESENRLRMTGGGEIRMNDARDATLHFRFQGTSIDPYFKFFAQELPYTKAIATGFVSVAGPLSDPMQLSVTATVEDADLTLFDYPIENDGEIELAFKDGRFRLEQVRFKGDKTSLGLSGSVDARNRTSDVHASGQANLAVLQAFYPSISAEGNATLTASLSGGFDDLSLVGRADISAGRLRHQDLPHGFSDINGPIVMTPGSISVAGLRAVLGGGAVDFGGTIELDGYRPRLYNLDATGRSMQLRVPEGLQSTVDARLRLRGPINAPVLSGEVDVLRASYLLRVQPETGYFDLLGGAAGAADPGPPFAPEAPSAVPITLDIRVVAPVTPFIDSSVATISASADVDIKGTIDRPIVTGRVLFDRGEWVFSGYRYRLQGGSIDFSNPQAFEPYFDVSATTRVRTTGQAYDVTLGLTGTLDKLNFSVTSEPWLDRFQVISLLLGESPDVGAAELRARSAPQELQNQALATAGFAFLTSPISATVGSVVERATAIDTVQIVPLLGNETNFQQLSPAARITLGKRISERVYLTYSRTLASGVQNEIILIEFDQNDQVSWVLSRNADRSFALDFRIKHVFR